MFLYLVPPPESQTLVALGILLKWNILIAVRVVYYPDIRYIVSKSCHYPTNTHFLRVT